MTKRTYTRLFIPLLFMPFFLGGGIVRFRQNNSMDPKYVIEQVRTAFPHAHCDYNAVDSFFVVDNFVNFDEAFFVNRMQQYGVNVSVLNTDAK